MATKVLKELAIAVSTYEDRNSGQTKNRYENIGVLMESTNDRGETNRYIMMKRSFNPAGVPFKQGSDKVLISLFDPKPRDGGGQSSQGAQSRDDGYGTDQSSGADRGGYDDSIPF